MNIINPFAYHFLIKPRFKICVNKSKNILIIVHSAVSNILERAYYRTTIGRDWIRKYFGFDIIFVIGKPSSSQMQTLIVQEAQTYGDILQGDFDDNYYNLTLKAVVWMKYIAENCGEKNQIIVKTDDDVMIDLKRLKETLLQYTEQLQNKYFCWSHKYMPIERRSDARWYMPETEMVASHRLYDEYCSGLAYVTSMSVITKQWEYLSTHKVHFNRIDDFFVTGKLAAEAEIGHISEPSMFNIFEINLNESLNGNGTFFLMHHRNTRQFLWKKMLKKWTNSLTSS
uniref:Hexosyltransferase n=1 Tax=Panagrolaimus superbus TaxID=310955 RepID=A0A914YKC2_9BILA